MDFLFLIVLIVMLIIFGYTQLQKDVYRIPGPLAKREDDEIKAQR